MKTLNTKRFSVVLTLALTGACAHAAGFQHGFAADPDGKPLEIGIWYPSSAAVLPVAMGPTTMSVAVKGPVQGKALPLVLISHGTGGSFLGHFDTAMALADAGFVVAAVTHTGDNYADQSRAVDIMDRPRQISRVIDHMLASWDGRAAIDPARVGMFGFSAGGFTTLANIGGVPDFKDRTGVPPIPGDLHASSWRKTAAATSPRPPRPPSPTRRTLGSRPQWWPHQRSASASHPMGSRTSRSPCSSGAPRTMPSFHIRATPKRCGSHCRRHRSTTLSPRPDTLTSWHRAAARWRRSHPPFAPALQVSIGSSFMPASMQRSSDFSA